MALILWTNDYSVGIEAFDNDHIAFASIINHIDEAGRFKSDEVVISSLLRALMNLVDGHFRREEELMARYRYPELDEHKKLHRVLRGRLKALYGEYRHSSKPEISDKAIKLLCHWFDEHILQTDMRYKNYLQEAMAASDAA
jgi:hemerythrin